MRVSPWVAAAAAVGAACAGGFLQQVVGGPVASHPSWWLVVLLASGAVTYLPLGRLALGERPGHPVGRLMIATGAFATAAVVAYCWADLAVAAWAGQWMWWPPIALIPLTILLLPDGSPPPGRRWRGVVALGLVAAVVGTVLLAAAASAAPRDFLYDVDAVAPGWARGTMAGFLVCAGASVLTFVAALAAVLGRWRRAAPGVRRQLAPVAAAGVVVLIGIVLDLVGMPGVWAVEGVAVPVGLCLAIVRGRWHGLDVRVNRVLVWLLLTLAVVVGFVAVVASIDALIGRDAGRTASIAVTGLLAVSFEPARRRVQRAVDHAVYGERDEPFEVVSGLSRRLEGVVEPTAALPELVATVTEALRLPYAAVEVVDAEGAPQIVAADGRDAVATTAFPMIARGRQVGRLLVSPRGHGERFSDREADLLSDLARAGAVAVDASRLAIDLQHSRERLVLAREEERRRLRHDLHDGVGPSLAGMALQVRAARRLVGADAQGALDDIAEDLRVTTGSLRVLVDRLRPPALDRGLVAALGDEARRFHTPGELEVGLEAPADLGDLGAAVEVAALRIASEALANCAKHSGATHCRLELDVDSEVGRRVLRLEVCDDGRGMPALLSEGREGVGLRSMRERAEELGGSLTIEPRRPSGTRVRVRLPVQAPVTDAGPKPRGQP